MNILEIKNLSLKISDKKILDNINFTLKEKEIISIIGQSGSGKTMLSKMIMGLKNKNMEVEGEILFKDKNIFDFSEEDLRKYRGEGIGYITQNPLNVFLPFQKIKTTFLETYLSHKNISKKEVIELAKKNLKQVNLDNADEILNKYPFELSGGMLQRVMIALIVGLDSKIIIADEVTSALDSYNRHEIIKIFKELNNIGKSIILITHDYYLMKAISDRCLVMENGEVIEKFNPKTDPIIPVNYDIHTFEVKVKNKLELQKELGLEVSENIPLIGMVTRLTHQKGIDLLLQASEDILRTGAQLVILGTGDAHYESALRSLENYRHDRVRSILLFSNEMSAKIYASSDIFLMPSKTEPCGLSQLISMRYGTVPVVHRVGGLRDTVIPFTGVEGNGFTFESFQSGDMMDAIYRAVTCFYQSPDEWNQIIKNNLNKDVSWEKSAKQYLSLYQEVL